MAYHRREPHHHDPEGTPVSQDARRPSDPAEPALTAAAAAVGAPDLILPWLDRFYDDGDVELLLAAGEPAGLADVGAERLARAMRRAVLDRDEAGAYAPASFRDRLEIWAMLEGWKDIPPAVHRELAEWEVENYTASIRDGLEALKDGRPADSDQAGYTYLLLAEAEEVIASEEHVYLFPCDCRAIIGKCRKPVNVCLRFENDRDLGWEISTERAIEIVRAADRAGLMHTDLIRPRAGDPHAICNCCTDCCFPHLATERLGTGDVWPERRHVAAIDEDTCEPCGRCARRCPFAAITADSVGKPTLEPAACRGCGLCSTTCPTGSIAIQPLAAPV
jgi:Pyruvate/2-oxoacid:ferredoxin oxidoreductase delta subunit